MRSPVAGCLSFYVLSGWWCESVAISRCSKPNAISFYLTQFAMLVFVRRCMIRSPRRGCCNKRGRCVRMRVSMKHKLWVLCWLSRWFWCGRESLSSAWERIEPRMFARSVYCAWAIDCCLDLCGGNWGWYIYIVRARIDKIESVQVCWFSYI